MIRKLRDFSTSKKDAEQSIQDFIGKFRTACSPQWRLRMLQEFARQCAQDPVRLRSDTRRSSVWMVLPFHPAWDLKNLNKTLHKFCGDMLWGSVFREVFDSDVFQVRVSWKMQLPRATHYFQRVSMNPNGYVGGWGRWWYATTTSICCTAVPVAFSISS